MNHPPIILAKLFLVKLAAAVPIGVLANLLGGFDAWLGALIGFTAADIATGIAKGFITKTLNSKAMWRGGIRKILIFFIVGVAVELDGLVLHEHALRLVVLSYYIANEGNYGSVNKNDNGALSIGKVQWHASRALALMKSICAKHPALSKSILGSTLYNEITNAVSGAWNTRIVSAAEASLLSTLLTTAEGKEAQDALAEVDVMRYVQLGIKYGLTDVGALILFADGINQFGEGSAPWKTIVEKAIGKTPYKGKATGDAKSMLDAAMDTLGERWIPRRQKVYEKVLALGLGGAAPATPTKPVLPDLYRGIQNNVAAIGAAQLVLKALKFYTGAIDGSFGPLTEQAVIRFQTSKKLPATGKINAQTWVELIHYFEQYIKGEAQAVRWWQYILRDAGLYAGDIDGSFGPLTAKGTAAALAKLKA